MESIATAGISLPKLGFGTWRLEGNAARDSVESALALGYRHIDTAEMYANEEMVGRGIAASGIARDEIHLTTKVWFTHLAPSALRRSIETSLKKLRTDYVDLYLIHWPTPAMDLAATLGAMWRLREEGLARAIGVANFTATLLRRAVEQTDAPIACDQVEYHAALDQSKLLSYAREKKIPIVAYCPLARGQLANSPILLEIAAKHGATPAQVALAWLLGQEGVAAIPKSIRPERQKANLGALSLRLDEDDRAAIGRLPKNQRVVSPAFAPDWDEAA